MARAWRRFQPGRLDILGGRVRGGRRCGLIPALKGIVPEIPCPPVAAFIVGFVLYAVLAKIGIQTRTLKMPQIDQPG